MLQSNGNATAYNADPGLSTEPWPVAGPIEGSAFKPRKLRIVLLGASISGITFAHDAAENLTNFELDVYEKNSGLGGSWFENRYPGCACDVPAHTYQFDWAPNPNWSTFFAQAPEILAYLNKAVDDHGLRKYMHFNHRGVHAAWNEATATWHVVVEQTDPATGAVIATIEKECDVFVQATGILNSWSWPKIEGLQDFRGHLLHTANWDPTVDLKGKTIAVIGNGASAVQCVPALQPDVKMLYNYIRTPVWMQPHNLSEGKVQADYTPEERKRFAEDPEYYYQYRLKLQQRLIGLLASMCKGSTYQTQLKTETLDHMTNCVKDPAILDALRPDTEIGCRRPAPGDHYLNALQQPNARLVKRSIVRVTPTGICDDTGHEQPLDAIICATGFDTSYEPRFPILGRGGYPLSDNWGKDKDTESYMGSMVARFPNHFVFNPPICPITGSLFPSIALAGNYMIRVLQRLQRDGLRSVCVKDEAQTAFNQWVQSRMPYMAWSGNCSSWYKNSKGKVTAPWPGTLLHYAETISTIRWEDFDLEFANPSNKYASLGNGITTEGFTSNSLPWLAAVNAGSASQTTFALRGK